MQTHSQIARGISHITLLIAVLIIIPIAPRTFAQDTFIEVSFARSSKEPIPVNILTGQSCLVIFDKAIGRLAVSNLDTAEAVLVAPDQMSVNGKGTGRARFTVWSKEAGQFVFLDVDVRANLAQIDSQVRALFPKEDIRLSQASGSVVISGNVEPKVSQQVETVIQAAGFKTVNLLVQPILNVTQVQLQIRVAEVSRNKLSELAASPVVQTQPGQGGYTNTGLGPYTVNSVTGGDIFGSVASSLNLFIMSNNAFMFLRALQTQGALRALAEPNLIAMNGQQASFLAGGEIPIPFVQSGGGGNAVSIIFKEYGVRVNFKPTILDEQHIRLELEPEVSTLDYGNAVRLSGFLIPALRVRRAKTGIELQDGQSFGIAGLLDNSEQKSLSKIPIIGDVPILGNLFKSKSFQKNESELVFIVTAKIVRPLNPDAVPQMKGVDDLKGSSPLGVEVPGAAGGSTTGSGSGATSNVLPDSGSAASGDSTPGVKSTKSSESAKSSSMTSNVTPDRSNATSGAGATTAKSATSADGTGSNNGTTGGGGTAGVKSIESGESTKSSSMTSNVTPDRGNATSGAGATTAKSTTSTDGTGSNSGTTGAGGTAGVKSVGSGESTKSSSGATNIGPMNSSATSSVAVSSFMPPRNAATGESVTGVNGAKTGNGTTDGNATRNVTPGKNSASGKNTKSSDGTKSNSGAAVNITPGSDKTGSGNNPPTGKKTRSGGAARKRAGAADDAGATRNAPTPTKTSSRTLANRTIKGLTWKIRLPDFPTLAARRRRAKS